MKTCFVIMPFDEKPDPQSGRMIDFKAVYARFINPTVSSLGLTCLRCDEISKPGIIHTDMFTHIFNDDVAVVDITTLNANVFYELGVRHALNKSVTVLIRGKGTSLPFNISGLRFIEYDYANLDSDEAARQSLRTYVQQGLESVDVDSPIHTALPALRVTGNEKRLKEGEAYEYRLPGASQTLALVSGDLRRMKGIDVWVNSENTNMQMARFSERSTSSIIRYLGAKKDALGYVVEDTIADELATVMGNHKSVPANTVIATGAGELQKNGVKCIFHAATVNGQYGRGFEPFENVGDCVINALDLAATKSAPEAPLESILFQIMGGGTGGGNIEDIARKLLGAAITYMKANPESSVKRICFLVTRERTLEVCQKFLGEIGVQPVLGL